jgi:putative transposase
MRYESKKSEEWLLKERITSIAHEKRRYGYRRIHVLLKREGIKINHKKLFRIYWSSPYKTGILMVRFFKGLLL